jgi:hypothetical protein
MILEPIPLSAAESDARDIAMLRQLADITMDLTRALGRLALEKAAEGDAKAAGNLGVVVTRVGRALRQTIAYRRKIEDQLREGADKRAAEEAQQKAQQIQHVAQARRSRSVDRKHMIRRAVEQVLANQQADDDEDESTEREDRFDELYERLDEYESFTDFTDRPVSAFVADICNALGLEFDWDQFAYDPWAMQEAETEPEDSPFAEWLASTEDDETDDPLDTEAMNGTGPPLAAK